MSINVSYRIHWQQYNHLKYFQNNQEKEEKNTIDVLK